MADLGSINGLSTMPAQAGFSNSQHKVTPGEAHNAFAEQLKNAVDSINHTQIDSDSKTKALARGEINDLHDVMITSQKASITMQTAVEVQSKVVEAYKEIMRMQI